MVHSHDGADRRANGAFAIGRRANGTASEDNGYFGTSWFFGWSLQQPGPNGPALKTQSKTWRGGEVSPKAPSFQVFRGPQTATAEAEKIAEVLEKGVPSYC